MIVVNIEESSKASQTFGNDGITKLVKINVNHENNYPTFAGLTSHGIIKVFTEGEAGQMAKWIETVKVIKGGLGEITDITNMPSGALISVGVDKSIYFWEEKKGGGDACAACC